MAQDFLWGRVLLDAQPRSVSVKEYLQLTRVTTDLYQWTIKDFAHTSRIPFLLFIVFFTRTNPCERAVTIKIIVYNTRIHGTLLFAAARPPGLLF